MKKSIQFVIEILKPKQILLQSIWIYWSIIIIFYGINMVCVCVCVDNIHSSSLTKKKTNRINLYFVSISNLGESWIMAMWRKKNVFQGYGCKDMANTTTIIIIVDRSNSIQFQSDLFVGVFFRFIILMCE